MNINDFKSKTLFISGPMTGYENYNKEAFYAVEAKLRQAGFSSIKNPVHIGEKWGYEETHEFYMKKSLAMLLESDAIYVFGDYEKSKGANLEIELAHKLSIPVFFEDYDELHK